MHKIMIQKKRGKNGSFVLKQKTPSGDWVKFAESDLVYLSHVTFHKWYIYGFIHEKLLFVDGIKWNAIRPFTQESGAVKARFAILEVEESWVGDPIS